MKEQKKSDKNDFTETVMKSHGGQGVNCIRPINVLCFDKILYSQRTYFLMTGFDAQLLACESTLVSTLVLRLVSSFSGKSSL